MEYITRLNPNWDELIKLRVQIRDMLMDYWITHTVFSFNWWFLLISTLVIFAIWVFVLDKKRIIEISSFGLLVGTTTFILDTIGITLVLWSYPDRVIPVLPPIIEIHKVHLPIIYMIIYQYSKTWKQFTIWLTLASLLFSFVLEPLTVWLGIYEIHHWKYTYSFPIYILCGLILRWILIKAKQIERNDC